MSVRVGGSSDRLAWLLLCAVASCTSTEVRLPTDAPTDTTSGGVRRTTLTVSVKQSPADAILAASLGWPATIIPGATVVLRSGSGALEQTIVADASGEATFTGLLQGIYSINALRLLAPSEQASLPVGYSEVDALGGSRIVSIGASPVTADVAVQSTRRGTLVISELWSGDPAVGNGFYDDGDYLEIYNNSDAPIELTDKLVVEGFQGTFDNPDLNSCALTAPFQRDSLGIWSTMIYAFPPGAPAVPPGGVVLLATDAIDHTTISPAAFNLTIADLEFRGPADVDNPQVPDMLSVGPTDGGGLTGHGLSYYSSQPAIAIADRVDLAALPQQQFSGRTYVRVPATAIRDVITWGGANPTFPSCGSPIHPSLDEEQARVIDNWSSDFRSITRRHIGTLPNGRALLLRTRSSARDFIAAVATPGAVP